MADAAIQAASCCTCCLVALRRTCFCRGDRRVRNLQPLKLDEEAFNYVQASAAKPERSWSESRGMVNLGAAPPSVFRLLFQNLLNRSYSFLLSFILVGLVGITLVFWVPFIALVGNDPSAIDNCTTIADALAFAFASLFGVDSHYRAASSTAVFVVTAEVVVGKLAITALTALLVLKISKTPDNCIQSKRILVHKLKGKWTISVRVAVLYDQRLWDPRIYLSCISNTSNGWMPSTLKWSNHCLGHGFGRLDKLPLNLRHVVDETSPLWNVNFEDEKEVRRNLNCFILVIAGYDSVTGRTVGHEQRYDWHDNISGEDSRGFISYMPKGRMGDVLVNSKLLKEFYGASWSGKSKGGGEEITGGVDWRMFNLIKSPKESSSSEDSQAPTVSSLQDMESGTSGSDANAGVEIVAADGRGASTYAIKEKSR